MLRIENLQVNYGGIQALRGITLEVPDGKIVTLIGANGAGKSTTIRTISGIVKPVGGRIVFDDQDLIGVEPHNVVERGVVMTPEGRHVFSDMSVMENLQLGAHIRTDADGVAKDIEGVFKLFPRLQERRKQMAGTLSGGEQQMLAVGRAMMSNPKILMMDEPSLGLAPILVEKIFDIIRKIHDEGKTILLVEQNAHAALEVADYAYILETGQIVLEGPGAELARNDAVRKSYLGIL
jgi:branched-chain amino acid transport system ATP-binding protein